MGDIQARNHIACRPEECFGGRSLDLPAVDEEHVAEVARLHKALSDPTRLKILSYLGGGELCVCEILEALGVQQPTVSHHLMILQSSGFVKSRKQGRWVAYSINREAFERCDPFFEKGVQT